MRFRCNPRRIGSESRTRLLKHLLPISGSFQGRVNVGILSLSQCPLAPPDLNKENVSPLLPSDREDHLTEELLSAFFDLA